MFLAATPQPPPFTATVVRVIDGDTIVVVIPGDLQNPNDVAIAANLVTVRLACVDAPESRQPGGKESSAQLKSLLPLDTVVEIRPTGADDRYGRKIGFVFYGRANINLEQVATGQARFYSQYQSSCPDYANNFRKAEDKAKLNRVGLWVEPEPCAPWDWRSNRCAVLPDCKPVEIVAP
ncbi:thermonuclease family protein [Microcoleus sp. herbarium7]|uniref:thermonuclease family protein n=1 Tax=Microcoleus sp. herbarium7 TaxID=3055435 RepID=UPI002FD4743A